jgi:uncharacterized protein
VFLTDDDIENIAKATEVSPSEAIATYCRRVQLGIAERVSLREQPNFDCIFWDESGCKIYEYRPIQCRSYPFWAAIVASKESWEREMKNCPGVNKGKIHTKKEIEAWLALRERGCYIS